MSQGRFRATLQGAVNRDREAMMEEYRQTQKDIREKQSGSAMGRLTGGGLLGGIGLLAGLNPVTLAVVAGLGSRLGSEIGERGGVGNLFSEGHEIHDIGMSDTEYGFGGETADKLRDEIDMATSGHDAQQWLQAGSDAWTAYNVGNIKVGGEKILAGKGGYLSTKLPWLK